MIFVSYLSASSIFVRASKRTRIIRQKNSISWISAPFNRIKSMINETYNPQGNPVKRHLSVLLSFPLRPTDNSDSITTTAAGFAPIIGDLSGSSLLTLPRPHPPPASTPSQRALGAVAGPDIVDKTGDGQLFLASQCGGRSSQLRNRVEGTLYGHSFRFPLTCQSVT